MPEERVALESEISVLQFRLLGSIVPTLRAVSVHTPAANGKSSVFVRFVLDSQPTETIEEVFSDVIDDLISETPSRISDYFDYQISTIAEPGIIALRPGESLVFRRWEPGLLKLMSPEDGIRPATAPLPSAAEITETLSNLSSRPTTRTETSAWARYWVNNIQPPEIYPRENWQALLAISSIDRVEPSADHANQRHLISDLQIQKLIKELGDSNGGVIPSQEHHFFGSLHNGASMSRKDFDSMNENTNCSPSETAISSDWFSALLLKEFENSGFRPAYKNTPLPLRRTTEELEWFIDIRSINTKPGFNVTACVALNAGPWQLRSRHNGGGPKFGYDESYISWSFIEFSPGIEIGVPPESGFDQESYEDYGRSLLDLTSTLPVAERARGVREIIHRIKAVSDRISTLEELRRFIQEFTLLPPAHDITDPWLHPDGEHFGQTYSEMIRNHEGIQPGPPLM